MSQLEKRIPYLLFVLYCLWGVAHSAVYLDGALRLPRDNYEVAFPLFRYIVDYIRTFWWVPTWTYSLDGGIWFEPLANNYLVLLPYRLVGYVIGVFGIASPILAYKIAFLWVGVPAFFSGVYLLIRRIGFSRVLSGLFVVSGFLSSLGLGFLHQEQAFATVFYIPFLWLLFLKSTTDRRALVPFSALFGLSLNAHYPQIPVLYLLSVGLLFLVVKRFRVSFKGLSPKIVVMSLVAFFISASPLLYSYRHFKGGLRSPDRGAESLEVKSRDEYVRLNLKSATSLAPRNLLLYVGAPLSEHYPMGELDENNLFVTPATLLSLILLFLLRIPGSFFLGGTVVILGLFAVGIYGVADLMLWIPGVSFFRQWYHFTSILNLHLLFLNAICLTGLWVREASARDEKIFRWVAAGIVLLGLVLRLHPSVYAISAAVLLAKTYLPKSRDARVGALLVGWLVFSGAQWSHQVLKQVARFPHWAQLLVDNPEPIRFPAPYVGSPGEWKSLVLPKKSGEPGSIYELSKRSAFYWVSKNDALGGMKASAFKVKPVWNGWRLDLLAPPPKDSKGILFTQTAVSDWVVKDDKGDRVTYSPGAFGLMEIPLKGAKSYTIRHSTSGWFLWVLLAWVPFLLFRRGEGADGVLAAIRKQREGHVGLGIRHRMSQFLLLFRSKRKTYFE